MTISVSFPRIDYLSYSKIIKHYIANNNNKTLAPNLLGSAIF